MEKEFALCCKTSLWHYSTSSRAQFHHSRMSKTSKDISLKVNSGHVKNEKTKTFTIVSLNT